MNIANEQLAQQYFTILESLEPDQWDIELNQGWSNRSSSVRECVAHMVAWEKEAVIRLQETTFSEKLTSINISDYKKFNKTAVIHYSNYTNDALLEEWKSWRQKLILQLNTIDTEKLVQMARLFDWISNRKGKNHYSYHLAQIQTCLKTVHMASV